MGRPKGYDREKVIEAAMELYWKQGYEATSTQQLVDHLGINRNSMYSEFGSKREFFEIILGYYEDRFVARNFGPLEGAAAGLDEIRAVFNHYASLPKKRSGLGCLLCNTAMEASAPDGSPSKISNRFIGRITKAFENALKNSMERGGIRSNTDVAEQAHFFASSCLGMLVLLRANAPGSALMAVSNAAQAHLTTLVAVPA